MFIDFMNDADEWDMYVSGNAGTGKTTQLAKDVQWCIDNSVPHVVCAYTHKACGILRDKLPYKANVCTLHSFLKKRPGINQHAISKHHINTTIKSGEVDDRPRVMFIDEFSMVGEKDLMDIRAMQDPRYEGEVEMKVVWLGDPKQLPPVGDMESVVPGGKYHLKLTKQYRNDNPLQQPICQLIDIIEGTAEPAPLVSVPGYFERGRDIVNDYVDSENQDKVMLAYTNKRVQELNQYVADKTHLDPGDRVFSPSTQTFYTFLGWLDEPQMIDNKWLGPLLMGSKYKTLEHLVSSELCRFMEVEDDDGVAYNFAVVFGHYNYKVKRDELSTLAAASNKAIQQKYPNYKPAGWCSANPKAPLARKRAKAWRDFLSFNDYVICMDFPFAMTVHKSQGSTFEEVYLDTDDLAICPDFSMYARLMYVAISRASKLVVTS